MTIHNQDTKVSEDLQELTKQLGKIQLKANEKGFNLDMENVLFGIEYLMKSAEKYESYEDNSSNNDDPYKNRV